MSENGIAKREDFRAPFERANVEPVVLSKSVLAVMLCPPVVFTVLLIEREGRELQAKITEAKPGDLRTLAERLWAARPSMICHWLAES